MPPDDLRAAGYTVLLRSTIGLATIELWRGEHGWCVRRAKLVERPVAVGTHTEDLYRDDQQAAQVQYDAWVAEKLEGRGL